METINNLQKHLEQTSSTMEKAYQHVQTEFTKIRTSRASINIFDDLVVLYYNNNTPISQVATITVVDARTITIKPWDKKMISAIEKTIIDSNMGFTPQNNGEVITINIPPMTEEYRKKLVKKIKNEAERTKIIIRNARKNIKDTYKKLQKQGTSEDTIHDSEKKLQDLTDTYIKKIDNLLEKKENEIMKV